MPGPAHSLMHHQLNGKGKYVLMYCLFLTYLLAFIMLFYVAWWYVWSDIYEIIDIILNTRCSEQSEFCSVNPKTSIFIVFTSMDIERYADLSYALLFSWDRSQVGIDQYFSVLTIVWLWITKDLHGLPSGIYESVYIIAIFGSDLLLPTQILEKHLGKQLQ